MEKARLWRVLAILAAASIACGTPGVETSSRGLPSPPANDLTAWPEVQTEDCAPKYPQDLASFQTAFAGKVESVTLRDYEENLGGRLAIVNFRVQEWFYGIGEAKFIAVDSLEELLPEDDFIGQRVLVAHTNGLLLSCGFTRPYSDDDARFWRQTFAEAPPPTCGEEVLDCDHGDVKPVLARCLHASYEYAIYEQIDGGGFPFEAVGCNRRFLALRVDLGDCPPEATEEQLRECAREKRAYFVRSGDRWKLLTYVDKKGCAAVQPLKPEFPQGFCR